MNQNIDRQVTGPDAIQMNKCFEAWKLFSSHYKHSIQNNIIANHHYLLTLFKKTVRSVRNHQKLDYKQLIFNRLKRATLESIREVLHLRSILITIRKRAAVNSLARVYRYRKKINRALDVSNKYTALTLKKKYFNQLKVNTLLFKLQKKREFRTLKEACIAFVAQLKLFRSVMSNTRQKQTIATTFYTKLLVRKHFQRMKLLKIFNRYQKLRIQNLKTNLHLFISLQRRIKITYERKAKVFLRSCLLRRYFELLSNRTIEIKIVKLTKVKCLTKCFSSWLAITRKTKQQQQNIPIETVNSIEEIHRVQTLKMWFRKMKDAFQGKVANRNKKQIIEDYYELKSAEILYRKYFSKIKLYGRIYKAEKYYAHLLIRRVFQALQLNYIDQNNRKIMISDFAIKRQYRLMKIAMTGFRKTLQKQQKAFKFHYRSVQKRYLQRWLKSIVTTHLQNTSKALSYHSTNLKFKVIFALKEEVQIGHRIIDVLRIRLRGYLHHWTLIHRLHIMIETRALEIKTKVFRHLKLLRYTSDK